MKRIFLFSTITMIALTYMNEIASSGTLLLLRELAAIVMVLSGLTFAKRFTQILCLVIITVSFALGYFYAIDFSKIINGVVSNVPLAVLFMTVPFLSIPIKRGGYLDSVNVFFKRFSDSPNKFFFFVSSFLFMIGSVTSLASIRIVNDILSESKMPDKFLARCYGAGFAGCMGWSPYFAGVTLAVTYGGLSFLEFIPFGLGFSFLILVFALMFFASDKKNRGELQGSLEGLYIPPGTEGDEAERKARILGTNFLVLLVLVVVLERFSGFSSIMYLVSIVGLLYGGIWIYLVTCRECLVSDIRSHGSRMLQTANEAVFFLVVGILARAISLTPVREFLGDFFVEIAGLNRFLMIELVIFSVVFFAMLGIHQIVSITILGSILSPAILGIAPVAYTFIYVSAWMLSALFSPFTPLNMVIAETVNKSTFTVAFRYNLMFNIGLMILSGMYIFLLS